MPDVSTTNTNAIITMMIYSSVIHYRRSRPTRRLLAYPMPWFESTSVKSVTFAWGAESAPHHVFFDIDTVGHGKIAVGEAI